MSRPKGRGVNRSRIADDGRVYGASRLEDDDGVYDGPRLEPLELTISTPSKRASLAAFTLKAIFSSSILRSLDSIVSSTSVASCNKR